MSLLLIKAENTRQLGVNRSTITLEIKHSSVKEVKDVSGKILCYDAYFYEFAQTLTEKHGDENQTKNS